MAVETIRLFKGIEELNYADVVISITDDFVINTADIDIAANHNVISGSVIDFKKADGSTAIFNGKVQKIVKDMLWRISVFTNGYELMNIRVQNVYVNRSPEYIVEDVITNYTKNLTFASSSSSGFTIGTYIADGYLIDVIKDMMDILDWPVRIDVNDNVYFEPKGTLNNGQLLINGQNCQITSWEEDQDSMFNHVEVVGGFESFNTEETITLAPTTVFTLTNKPADSMKVIISGSEVSPEDYTVDSESKTVTFLTNKTTVTFQYSYNKPIIVENQNDDSINTYEEIFRQVPAPWLLTFADARKYSQTLLDIYSTPSPVVKIKQPFLNFNLNVSETIIVQDPVRVKNSTLQIKKIIYNAREHTTSYELGSRDLVLTDWQREVEDRIKKIEKRSLNTENKIFTRLFKSGLKITLETQNKWQYNSPTNTFFLNHPTLNRMRTVVNGHIENFEADCSNNSHNGVWYGSNVDGAQYVFPAYRLYGGEFNGTDTYINCVDSVNGVQCVSFFAKPAKNNQSILQLTSSASVSINSAGAITTTGLTDAKIYVNGVLSSTISTTSYKLVTVTFDSINATDFEVGRVGASYYEGELDEVMLWDNKLSTSNMIKILNKDWYDDNNDYSITGILLHWSMDNPKLGIRTTARSDL
jgi:hypothetical protein